MVPTVDYMSNRVTLTGTPEDVRRAKGLLRMDRDREISFLDVCPPSLQGNPDEACLDAWGCGLPETFTPVEAAPGSFSVAFDTGTGVPHKVMRALSERVPGLEVAMESVWSAEPQGHSFSGTWKDGQGGIEPVEASVDHYVRVRPWSDEMDIADAFPDAAPKR